MLTRRNIWNVTAADGVFVVALGLLIGAVLWNVHRPTYVALAGVGARLAEQERSRRALEDTSQAIERARRETEETETRLAAFEQRVFNATDSGSYLETISGLQDRCGVAVEQIDPGAPVVREGYEVRPVKIVAGGPFHGVLHFVHQLKAELWSAEVGALRIETKPKSRTCRLTLQVEFHVLTEGAEARGEVGGDGASGPEV